MKVMNFTFYFIVLRCLQVAMCGQKGALSNLRGCNALVAFMLCKSAWANIRTAGVAVFSISNPGEPMQQTQILLHISSCNRYTMMRAHVKNNNKKPLVASADLIEVRDFGDLQLLGLDQHLFGEKLLRQFCLKWWANKNHPKNLNSCIYPNNLYYTYPLWHRIYHTVM